MDKEAALSIDDVNSELNVMEGLKLDEIVVDITDGDEALTAANLEELYSQQSI